MAPNSDIRNSGRAGLEASAADAAGGMPAGGIIPESGLGLLTMERRVDNDRNANKLRGIDAKLTFR
jgi:hypothetical protein